MGVDVGMAGSSSVSQRFVVDLSAIPTGVIVGISASYTLPSYSITKIILANV
jgi:hypothetical protein